MGDMIFYLFLNIFLLTILFWMISIFSEYFFKKHQENLKSDFYECGFKSQFKLNFYLNLNFIFMLSMFLLYDSELLLMLPIMMNYLYLNLIFYFFFIFFLFFFFLSFFFDDVNNSFYWMI